MNSISTRVAGEFICDSCGRNSHFSWVLIDIEDCTPEDAEQLKELMPDGISVFIAEPNSVVCSHCGITYDVCHNPGPDHTHKNPTIEPFHAGEFVCEDCGETNYFSLTVIEGEHEVNELPDNVSQLTDSDGVYDESYFSFPPMVHCHSCGRSYEPIGHSEDDTADENDEPF